MTFWDGFWIGFWSAVAFIIFLRYVSKRYGNMDCCSDHDLEEEDPST